MRTYDIAMGKTPEYMAAVREVALPVRESYGVKLAGWYYTDIGALNKRRPYLGVPRLHAL